MNVRARLTVATLAMILVPCLAVGGIAVLSFGSFSRASARSAGAVLQADAERAMVQAADRECDLVRTLLASVETDAVALAGSESVTTLLGGADAQVRDRALQEVEQGVQEMGRGFRAQTSVISRMLDKNLNATWYLLEQKGAPCLSSQEPEPWTVVNQETGTERRVALPRLLFGESAVRRSDDPGESIPEVDLPARLTGSLITIFQRVDEAGDMLRIATTVRTASGSRAIGTAIPAVRKDGRPNPVVEAALAGRDFLGIAKVVGQWCVVAYRPFKDDGGRVLGMVFAGLPVLQEPTLGTVILDRRYVGSGHGLVLDGDGRVAIHPRPELLGRHVVADLGLTPFRTILEAKTDDAVHRLEYDLDGRRRIGAGIKLPPWGWTVAYAADQEEVLGAARARARSDLGQEALQLWRSRTMLAGGASKPMYNQIRVLDRTGMELMNLQQGRPAKELKPKAHMAWFKGALTQTVGKAYIHPVEVAANTGEAELRLVVPVGRLGAAEAEKDAVVGYVAMSMDWALLRAFTANHTVGRSGYPWIIDGSGLVLTHPRLSAKDGRRVGDEIFGPFAVFAREQLLKQETGVGRCVLDGVDSYTAFRRLQVGAGSYVVAVTQPTAEALEVAEGLHRQAERDAGQVLLRLAAGVLVSVLIGVVFGIWFGRRLIQPLQPTERVLAALAGGDLRVRLSLRRSDEFGRMSSALDQAVEGMANTVRGISGHSSAVAGQGERLGQLGAELAQAAGTAQTRAEGVAAAAQQVTASVGSTAAGIEELQASVKEIARNAAEAATVAREGVSAAEGASSGIARLAKTGEEIGGIVQLIAGIAEQVNLLALNAAIEAAGAGEAGRGFAVVANEVKELARRTSSASADIAKLILQVQGEVQENRQIILRVADLIRRMDGVIQAVAAATEEQAATTSEMGRAVQEASAGVAGIARDITGVAEATRGTSQATGEARQAAAELTRLSGALNEAVGKFRW